MWVHLNDRLRPAEEACVSVFDRGFLYGDGVFETFAVRGRRAHLLDEHLARLARSAAALRIALPHGAAATRRHLTALLDANSLNDAIVRIAVSRGRGPRGPGIAGEFAPTYVIAAHEPPALPPEEGIALAIVQTRRVSPGMLPTAAKHANYLNAVLAFAEAAERGADEAILLAADGHLAECATANLFLVRGGTLLTPPVSCGILPGITRAAVITLAAAAGVDVREQALPMVALDACDEAFITNAVKGVVAVARVGPRQLAAPGPLTRRLRDAYGAHAALHGVRV